jgi:hypothetical protein
MDNKEKKNYEKMFQEGNFPFHFKKFEEMAAMMKNCCTGEGDMADCWSMMKKMMRYGEGEETTKKKKDTKENTSVK